MARPDRFGRGGDHSAYTQLGFTAVGFRESRENFTRPKLSGSALFRAAGDRSQP